MTTMDLLMLLFGFAVVWGFGVALVAAIAARDAIEPATGDLAWTVGCGWFVGAFLLTLWMRVLAQIQVPFGIASIGLPLAAATGLLAWRARTLNTFRWSGAFAPLAGRNLGGWQRAIWLILLGCGNWNLLWYGALAVAVLARRHLLSREVAPYTAMVAAGLMFLLFGFAFTSARAWVEDQSTVNRATLHLAPLVIVWMLLSFRAWARHLSERPGNAVLS